MCFLTSFVPAKRLDPLVLMADLPCLPDAGHSILRTAHRQVMDKAKWARRVHPITPDTRFRAAVCPCLDLQKSPSDGAHIVLEPLKGKAESRF
jgi:hypothetical protein